MKAANLEQGFVIRYDDKPWHVRDRAISTARGDGCVILAELHDPSFDVFVGYPVALVFDRFDEEVWVYHFASSPHPDDWAQQPVRVCGCGRPTIDGACTFHGHALIALPTSGQAA